MVDALKKRYKPTKNTTLSNFEFHKLEQKEAESFDLFVNRVKHEAALCEFKCVDGCTVQDILIRDQIIVGTSNDEIRKNALKQQWGLQELILNGRSLEAASQGANKITSSNRLPTAVDSSDIRKVRKPGKYSRKKKAHDKLKQGKPSKPTCQYRNIEIALDPTCRGQKNEQLSQVVSAHKNVFDGIGLLKDHQGTAPH